MGIFLDCHQLEELSNFRDPEACVVVSCGLGNFQDERGGVDQNQACRGGHEGSP
jgi:hypothetical protein